jgi:cyclopropane fatty-acyl-phospholipid synthase-like methyltransferase
MCNLNDFDHLKLDPAHREMVSSELDSWHEWYLPVGNTVLDVGAGNGETAQFYLNHGARKIIGIEGDKTSADIMRHNFPNRKVLLVDMDDVDILVIRAKIDSIKSDCEGAERNMVVETHFPFYLQHLQSQGHLDPVTSVWKFVPAKSVEKFMHVFWPRLHMMRIQIAHFVKRMFAQGL